MPLEEDRKHIPEIVELMRRYNITKVIRRKNGTIDFEWAVGSDWNKKLSNAAQKENFKSDAAQK